MLKRLELQGFKSFGKKTVLEFTTPVTAIVGPNGSGKSNIVESIRFVLGEQSMKSLRGKAGTDLIFKGSKGMSAPSRASVAIVFDNSRKTFGFSSGSPINLDFDEIILSREVYADGSNRYLINGTEVRLKDIVELLASVHIGASGHHIISQGEADRILNSSSKDRRAMIEDALGLKIYQYKIRESERKLEKTLLNMKEVELLRREIAPHISFLKKQVEKVEKANQMREELSALYRTYFAKESRYIHLEKAARTAEREAIDNELAQASEALKKYEHSKETHHGESHHEKIADLEQGLQETRRQKADLERTIGRLEGMQEALAEPAVEVEEKNVVVARNDMEMIISTLEEDCDAVLGSSEIGSMRQAGEKLKSTLRAFRERVLHTESHTINHDASQKRAELEDRKKELAHELEKIEIEEKAHMQRIFLVRAQIDREREEHRDAERTYFELTAKRGEVESRRAMATLREEQLEKIMVDFANEVHEANALVGATSVRYEESTETTISRAEQELERKKIERIKIKLEDVGGGGGADILKEFNEATERDTFLKRELEDLSTSIGSLRALIGDLKLRLDTDFKVGIEKINKAFQEFFALMFGGGSAFLAVTVEHKKVRKGKGSDEGEDEEDMEEEIVADTEEDKDFERGIEINVSLPQKKVKDLHMLSGGERSLTSIALLFAMSQVNPPPFLVLDETDAALDEANSRKYGNMLESLSKYSELIVVTHNRETMSCAQVLYGITMGSEGASKLLSIRFDEASSYAK